MDFIIFELLKGNMFGNTEFLGLNIGFWIAMGVVVLITIIQNIWFWTRKKYVPTEEEIKKLQESREEYNEESDD